MKLWAAEESRRVTKTTCKMASGKDPGAVVKTRTITQEVQKITGIGLENLKTAMTRNKRHKTSKNYAARCAQLRR